MGRWLWVRDLSDFKPLPTASTPFQKVAFTSTSFSFSTVDGRNPAPPGMYKTLFFHGISTTNLNCLAGFLPSTTSSKCPQVSPAIRPSEWHYGTGGNVLPPHGPVVGVLSRCRARWKTWRRWRSRCQGLVPGFSEMPKTRSFRKDSRWIYILFSIFFNLKVPIIWSVLRRFHFSWSPISLYHLIDISRILSPSRTPM